MKLTTEQAKAILEVEPFVIIRMVIDAEGCIDYDFRYILVATNAAWDDELTKFIDREVNNMELFSNLRSSQADYLWHIHWDEGTDPYSDGAWELLGYELVASEPFVVPAMEE